MNVNKENALHDILEQFDLMAKLVYHQLELMENILNSGTVNVDEQILSEIEINEVRIDEFETTISDKIIDMIVLQKPVASDLRKTMAAYQMVSNLERIEGALEKSKISSKPYAKSTTQRFIRTCQMSFRT